VVKLVTNNPRAKAWWAESESFHVHILWQSGGFISVLTAARDLVHQGWRLLNHPLSSSIKPNQTPYKTLVLVPGQQLDLPSLQAVEAALEAVAKLGTFPGADANVLADLELLDLEMCKDINIWEGV